MFKNKIFLTFIVVAVVALVLLLVLRNTEKPAQFEKESEVETNVVPAMRTKQTSKQAIGGTATKVPAVNKQSLTVAAEQIDVDLRGLDDVTVEYYSQRAEYMLDNPVHPGRAKLQQQMCQETAEETFLHLIDNDNFAMLMPSMKGYPFSPGVYESDVMIVSKMIRVRKLLADAKADPEHVASLLQQQIVTLAKEFPEQYREYQRKQKNNGNGSYYSHELPDYLKTRIRCTVAVYILSQIDASGSLPVLAWLSAQSKGKRSAWPVNRKFLFYAMHRLVQKSAGTGLSGGRDRYLEKAKAMNIPNAKHINATTWEAYYHEDDFRRMLPGSKIDLRLQPTIILERFPSFEHISSYKIESLLSELSKMTGVYSDEEPNQRPEDIVRNL